MKHARQAVFVTGLGIAAFGVMAAEPDVPQTNNATIDEVVVVANKAERSIREIAANVTVLSQQDLSVEMAASMADALRYIPGIDYEGAGTRFGDEGVNIRGIGGNRVALLLDGVAISDQFDVGRFSNATRDFVDAGFIERAEILHGPASAIYGSAAIGGVVSLRSPDPADISHRATSGGKLASTWRGADSSWRATAMHALQGDSLGLLLGLGTRHGEEWDSAAVDANADTRAYERDTAMLKLVADDALGNAWKLGWYGQNSDVTSRLTSMLGTGRFRSTTALEGDDNYRMNLLSLEYGFGASSAWLDSGVMRIHTGDSAVEQKTLDERGLAARPVTIDRLFVFEQASHGVELNLQKEAYGRVGTHRIGFGIEYRRRDTEEYRDGLQTGLDDGIATKELLGEVFPLRDFPVSRSDDWGIYLEDAVTVGDWTLVAGLRGDRYDLEPTNDAMYAEDYPFAEPVALSDAELSPKFGLIFKPLPQLDLYLQYAHGFRAPPYADANIGLEIPLFNFRAIPNPDLRPESSDGIDLGLRWQGASHSLNLSLFRTEYEDFIESKMRIGVDPVSGRLLFQSRNLSATVIEGVEAGWALTLPRPSGTWSLDGSLYWARGENLDNGEPLNSVGPPQAVLGIDWLPGDARWQARLKATFTDGWTERDESGGALFAPPGHAVFDLFLVRQLGGSAQVRAGITNLADRTYWSWSDVRGLGPQDPVLPYIARPGRSVSVGIDMRW